MANVQPFAALRPRPELAPRVCELPYDVMSSEEARTIARGNPLSFLRVSKPEIDLPAGTNIYSPVVYAKGKENFQKLIADGVLRRDPKACYYLYRQTMGNHSQTGIVAGASCQEYLDGIIKKHELTRPDKEDDRVRHIETLEAQTGPAFLAFRDKPAISEFIRTRSSAEPEVDFTAADGVRHTSWVVSEAEDVGFLREEFASIPALYIADGHHRSAAAGRVYRKRNGSGGSSVFLSVIFPHDQLRILPYNRVLKDMNGVSVSEMLQRLSKVFEPAEPGNSARQGEPSEIHHVSFYAQGRWHAFRFKPEVRGSGGIESLDVSILQHHVLKPFFGIDDPRTSQRIQFVGGIRGVGELEKLVNSAEYACAFSLFPTSIGELMAIADENGIMPPKSTWFEPKLRDAMFCHML